MATAPSFPPTGPPYPAPTGWTWIVVPSPAGPTWSLSQAAAPTAPAAASSRWPAIGILLLLAVIAFMAWERWANPSGPPTPKPVDFVAVGSAFHPELVKAQAKAFRDFGDAIGGGKSMADSLAAEQSSFKAGRKSAIDAIITPHLNTILSPGTEPKDQSQRDAIRKAFQDMATGQEAASHGRF